MVVKHISQHRIEVRGRLLLHSAQRSFIDLFEAWLGQIIDAKRTIFSAIEFGRINTVSGCSLHIYSRLQNGSREVDMQAMPLPVQEDHRIQVLQDLRVLDTQPSAGFDDITTLAAYFFAALVSFMDGDRVWLKAKHGLDACKAL